MNFLKIGRAQMKIMSLKKKNIYSYILIKFMDIYGWLRTQVFYGIGDFIQNENHVVW